jgi:hypothetical protein
MWIIVDWNDTQFIGPFDDKQKAREWLKQQVGQEDFGCPRYFDFSIHQLTPLNIAKLKEG